MSSLPDERAAAPAPVPEGVPFAAFYDEIRRGSAQGLGPWLPTTIEELEANAHAALSPRARAYLFGGAGSGSTMRANVAAFERWRLVPRAGVDVSARDHRTTVVATQLPAPVLVAPIGGLTRYHRDGELAVAAAAAALGLPYVLSGAADATLEEVADAGGEAPRWFQLYWPSVDAVTLSMVERAARAGYEAIVVTVDAALAGWRATDLRGGDRAGVVGRGIANVLHDPAFRALLGASPEEDPHAAHARAAAVAEQPPITWERLEWLRERSELPVVVKGVQHADDAREAVRRGMAAVVVSNHGGRQVDGAIASLEALPDVVAAVDGAIPVLFDSGVRSGADICKAIALGADAVLVGRPYIWGLALDGRVGVEWVLRCLLAEMDMTVGLLGCTSAAAVGRDALVRDGG